MTRKPRRLKIKPHTQCVQDNALFDALATASVMEQLQAHVRRLREQLEQPRMEVDVSQEVVGDQINVTVTTRPRGRVINAAWVSSEELRQVVQTEPAPPMVMDPIAEPTEVTPEPWQSAEQMMHSSWPSTPVTPGEQTLRYSSRDLDRALRNNALSPAGIAYVAGDYVPWYND